MDEDRYLYPPMTLVILIGAAIGYLVVGLTGAVVAVVAAYIAMMGRQDIRRKRALRRCAEDATAALRGALEDAPGLADALRELGERGSLCHGGVVVVPDLRRLSAAGVLHSLLQSPDRPGPGHIDWLNIGYAALFRRLSAVEREVVNVLGGPGTLIVVPAARRQRVWKHWIPLPSPVPVSDALEALKSAVEAGLYTSDASGASHLQDADRIREQLAALIQDRDPSMARRFDDEVGNYDRGITLLHAMHESKAFLSDRPELRSGTETVFDAQLFLDYLTKRGWRGFLQNTEQALLHAHESRGWRGAEMGAVMGWRADALKSPPLWLGEPMMVLGLIGGGAAIGFLAAGFTGAAVGVLVAVWVAIWANS